MNQMCSGVCRFVNKKSNTEYLNPFEINCLGDICDNMEFQIQMLFETKLSLFLAFGNCPFTVKQFWSVA